MKKYSLENAYKGKKVFITGITGFKGSWLALLLKELGATVYGLGLPILDSNSIYYQAKINNFAKVFITDIRNLENNSEVYSIMTNCDYVFHLAAQPLVSTGYNHPVLTFETNVMGTLYIQEILRTVTKPLTFVNITTDKVYQPSSHSFHSENDILKGVGPYSLSKSFSDMLTELYRDSYFKDVPVKSLIVRAGNVIGGGDFSKDRIVVDLVNSLMTNSTLQLRNPNSVRPYQFVLDCLIQYLYIAAFGEQKEYNVGPTDNTIITTIELVEEFHKLNNKLKYNFEGASIGEEDMYLTLNTERFQNEFHKIPYANSKRKLAEVTFEWYNNLMNKSDMVEFSEKQVKEIISYYDQA